MSKMKQNHGDVVQSKVLSTWRVLCTRSCSALGLMCGVTESRWKRKEEKQKFFGGTAGEAAFMFLANVRVANVSFSFWELGPGGKVEHFMSASWDV